MTSDFWVTVSALATAGGTLALAVATFFSVRTSHRAARATERALLVGMRPLLMPTRPGEPAQPVGFADGHTIEVPGGGGTAEVEDFAIYLTISVRNAGTGLAVLHGWNLAPRGDIGGEHAPLEEFVRLSRDLYVAPSDFGFWQGALRDPGAAAFGPAAEAISTRERIVIDLLYGDLEGGQRTVSRFGLLPRDDGPGWDAVVSRHWSIDQPGPR